MTSQNGLANARDEIYRAMRADTASGVIVAIDKLAAVSCRLCRELKAMTEGVSEVYHRQRRQEMMASNGHWEKRAS